MKLEKKLCDSMSFVQMSNSWPIIPNQNAVNTMNLFDLLSQLLVNNSRELVDVYQNACIRQIVYISVAQNLKV